MFYRNGIFLLIHISAVVSLSNGQSTTTIEALAVTTQHINSDITDANDRFSHTTPDNKFYPEMLSSINPNELATERSSHADAAASEEDETEQSVELQIRQIADLKKAPSDNGVRLTNFMSSGSKKYEDFEEFTLSNEMVNSSERTVMGGDDNHVFKIGKGHKKSKLSAGPGRTVKMATANDTVTSFQVFTQLFDHNEWNEAEILQAVTWWCGEEMSVYLKALSNADLWAMKGIFE